MTRFAYFIMTPGVEAESYVEYPDGLRGVYIKFGDQATEPTKLGIRNAYRTHNPDIGVAAVVKSDDYNNLGTLLKQEIAALRWPSVESSEWFSIVPAHNGHELFYAMRAWDKEWITVANFIELQQAISDSLGWAAEDVSRKPTEPLPEAGSRQDHPS